MYAMNAYMTGQELAARPVDAELLGRFFELIDAKPQTLATYRRALKPFLLYLCKHGITKPTRRDVLNYRDEIRATLQAGTVQVYITAVRLFFKWTYQEGIYPNVAEGVKGATPSTDHKKDYLTSSQARATLEGIDRGTLQGKRDYAMVLLMLTLGLRTIEVRRANVEDIRPVADNLAMYYQGKGEEDKGKFKLMGTAAQAAILDYLRARGKVNAKDPLFAGTSNNNKGGRMTTTAISGIAKAYMVKAGYSSDRLTAHSLRHSAATLNLMNGASLEETQAHLGHKKVNSTMVYAHHISMATNKSGQRIEGAILGYEY